MSDVEVEEVLGSSKIINVVIFSFLAVVIVNCQAAVLHYQKKWLTANRKSSELLYRPWWNLPIQYRSWVAYFLCLFQFCLVCICAGASLLHVQFYLRFLYTRFPHLRCLHADSITRAIHVMYFTRCFHYLRNPYPQNDHYPQFHYTRIKSTHLMAIHCAAAERSVLIRKEKERKNEGLRVKLKAFRPTSRAA